MRILMLGNSLTFANGMPRMLAELTGAEVVYHTRGGARLSEQLNPKTKLGARTQAALTQEHWDYAVLQEMSHGPGFFAGTFFVQRGAAVCDNTGEWSGADPLCHLGLPAGQRSSFRQGLGL
ncbi:hypothetical protein AGATL06_29410 [Agathobaculum sp. TL06]